MKYAFQNSSVKSARRPRRVRNRNAARYARVERPVKYAGINGISGVSAPSASSSDGVKGIDGIQGGGDRQGKSKKPSVFYNGREWRWDEDKGDYTTGFYTNGHAVVISLKEQQERDRKRHENEANRPDDETWGIDDSEKPIKDAPDENDRKICSTVGNNLNLGWSRAFDLIAEAKENGDEERAKYLVGIVVKNAADIHRRGFLVHGAQDALAMINGELKEGGLASMREHLKNVALKLADAKSEELRDLSEQLFQRYVDAGGDQSRLSQEERKRVRKPAEEKRVDDEDYIPDVGDESAPESQNKENIVDDIDEEEEEEEEDEDEPPSSQEEKDANFTPNVADEDEEEKARRDEENKAKLEAIRNNARKGFINGKSFNDVYNSSQDAFRDYQSNGGRTSDVEFIRDEAAKYLAFQAVKDGLIDPESKKSYAKFFENEAADKLKAPEEEAFHIGRKADMYAQFPRANDWAEPTEEPEPETEPEVEDEDYIPDLGDETQTPGEPQNEDESQTQEQQEPQAEREPALEPQTEQAEPDADDSRRARPAEGGEVAASTIRVRDVSDEQKETVRRASAAGLKLQNASRYGLPSDSDSAKIAAGLKSDSYRALRILDGKDRDESKLGGYIDGAKEKARKLIDLCENAPDEDFVDQDAVEETKESLRGFLDAFPDVYAENDEETALQEIGNDVQNAGEEKESGAEETTSEPEAASREIVSEVNPSEPDAEEYAPSVVNDVDDEVTEEDLDEIRRNYDKLVDAFDSSRESVAHWVGVCKRRDATGEFDESSLWSTEASVWRACLKDAHGDQELAFVNFRELAIQNVKRLRETKAELAYYLLSSLRQVPDEWKDKYGNSVALDKENGAFVVEGEMAKDVAAYHRNTGGEGQVKRVRKGKYIIPYTYYSFQKAFCVVEPENLDELFESAREQLFNEREDDEEFVPDAESETTEVEASAQDVAPEESAPEPSEAASREIVSEVNPPEPDPDAASGDEADAQSVQNETENVDDDEIRSKVKHSAGVLLPEFSNVTPLVPQDHGVARAKAIIGDFHSGQIDALEALSRLDQLDPAADKPIKAPKDGGVKVSKKEIQSEIDGAWSRIERVKDQLREYLGEWRQGIGTYQENGAAPREEEASVADEKGCVIFKGQKRDYADLSDDEQFEFIRDLVDQRLQREREDELDKSDAYDGVADEIRFLEEKNIENGKLKGEDHELLSILYGFIYASDPDVVRRGLYRLDKMLVEPGVDAITRITAERCREDAQEILKGIEEKRRDAREAASGEKELLDLASELGDKLYQYGGASRICDQYATEWETADKEKRFALAREVASKLKKYLPTIAAHSDEGADLVRRFSELAAKPKDEIAEETDSESDAQYLGDLFQHEGSGSNVDPNAPIPEIKSRFDYKIGNIDSDEIDMGDWSVKIDPASRSVKVETRGDLAADDEFREMLEQQAEFQPADTEYGFNSQGTRDAYSFYLTPDLIENFKQSGVLPRDYEPQRKPTSDDEFFAKKTGDEKLDAAKASFVEFARLRNPTDAEIDEARKNVVDAFQAFAPDDGDSPELARRKREAFMRGIAFAVKNYLGEKEGKYVDQRLASVEEKEGDDAQYDKSVFNVSRELIRKLDRDAQKLILGGKSFADFFPDATRARKRTEQDPETAPRDSREIASAPVSDDGYKPLASGAGVSRAASIYDDEPVDETSEPEANAAEIGGEADEQALGEQTEERGFVGDREKRWNDVLEMRLRESVNSLRMSDAFQREAADSVKKIDALLEKGRRSEAAAEGSSLTKTAVRWYGRLKESGVADTHADETFLRLLGASTVPNDERDASPVSFDRALRAMDLVEPNGARYALIFNDAIDRASDSQGEDFGFAKKEIPEKGFEKVFFDLSSDLPSQVEKEIRDRVVDGAFRDAVSNAIRQTNHGCDETDALRKISKDKQLLKWAYQYCSSGYGQNPSSEKERKSLAKKIEKRLGKMLVDEYGVAERGEADAPVDNAPQTPEASAQSVAPEESAPSATLDEQIDSASDDEIASGVSNAPVSKTEESVADVGNDAQDEEETEPPRSPVVSEDKKKGIVTYKSDAFGANIKERKVKRDEREYLVPVVKLKSFNLDREREFVRYVERLEDNAPASEVVDKCLEILGGVSRAGANTPEEWRYRYAELEELRRVLTKIVKDAPHQGDDMLYSLERIETLDGRRWTKDFSNLFDRINMEEDSYGAVVHRTGYEPRRAKDSRVSGDGIGPNATAFDKAYQWDYQEWWEGEQQEKRKKQAEKSPTPAEPAPEPPEAASREIASEVNPPEPDPDAASGDEADAQSVAEETEERDDEYNELDDIKRAKARQKEVDTTADRFFASHSKDSQLDADKRELKSLLDARLEAIEKERKSRGGRSYFDTSDPTRYDAERAAREEQKEAAIKAEKIIAKYAPTNSESERGASELTSQRDLMFLIGSSYLRQSDSRNLPYITRDIYLFEEGTKKYSPDDFRYIALFNQVLKRFYLFDSPRYTIEKAREATKNFKAPSFKGFVEALKDDDERDLAFDRRFSNLITSFVGSEYEYTAKRESAARQAVDIIVNSKELSQLAYQYCVAKSKEENARAAFDGTLRHYSDCKKDATKIVAPLKSETTRRFNKFANALREAMRQENPQQTEDEDGA